MNAPQKAQPLGPRGEALAVEYLKGRGYHVVATNWRCPSGEIDVIARHDDVLVFIEVRARRAGAEAAFESITPRKQARILSAAQHFLAERHQDDIAWRVDVIAVALPRSGAPRIEHIEDAFGWR